MQLRAMAMARWVLPVPVPPTSTALRCWAMKSAAGEVVDECLIDWRTIEVEVIEVLGERQLGYGELVFDRARLLLADFRVKQIADDALGLMLAFDSGGHDLVEGGLHAIELEFAHEVEELSSFHHTVLLRLS
jgi:hypothetical protein